jgi:Type II secretion system (T2SS), protein F
MLSKVADFYDQEVEAAVASLTSMIEPILIAVMGAAVDGIVIALYMPLFNSIAISTFLGARPRAQNRAAQASLRNALVAAKSIYTDKQDYGQAIKTASADPLEAVEPTLN